MTKSKSKGALGPEGRQLYDEVRGDYHVDDAAGRALLVSACEARDRIAEARKAIAADGLFLIDRAGRKYAHPAMQIEISATKSMLAALRALKLSPGGE